MRYLKFVLPAILLALSANVNATIITNEDFSSPATGWSNNTRSYFGSNIILGGYNVLGTGDELSKDYSLTSNFSQISIEFDFYRIDSWDAEDFIVKANNTILASDTYQHSPPGVGTNTVGSGWDDEIIHYSLLFNSSIDTLTLNFSTTLDSSPLDESWGIDNLVITEVSAVPVPAAAWLFGSALLGFFGFSRRKANA